MHALLRKVVGGLRATWTVGTSDPSLGPIDGFPTMQELQMKTTQTHTSLDAMSMPPKYAL